MGIAAAGRMALDLGARISALASHVDHGFRGLRTHMVAQDRNGNKMLELPQLKAAFESAGVYLSEQDYEEISARFDFNDDGSVHYDELLHGIRLQMNAAR